MKGIIDRFEGNFAIVERDDGKMKNISIDLIPIEAKEGDVLIFMNKEIIIDKVETFNRKEKIKNLMDELFE